MSKPRKGSGTPLDDEVVNPDNPLDNSADATKSHSASFLDEKDVATLANVNINFHRIVSSSKVPFGVSIN